MSNAPSPSACRLAVRLTANPRAEEYIRECEHQDDEGFWSNFSTLEDLLEDFVRYCAMPPPPRRTDTTNLTPSELCPCRSCGHTVIHLDAEGGWFHVDGSKCFEDDGATAEQLRVQLATHPLAHTEIEDDVWETLHPLGLLHPDYSNARHSFRVTGRVVRHCDFTVTVKAETQDEAWALAEERAEGGDVEWGDDFDRNPTVELSECEEEKEVTICTCGSWPKRTRGPSNIAHSDDCGLMLEELKPYVISGDLLLTYAVVEVTVQARSALEAVDLAEGALLAVDVGHDDRADLKTITAKVREVEVRS